jgi:hypothetical protein
MQCDNKGVSPVTRAFRSFEVRSLRACGRSAVEGRTRKTNVAGETLSSARQASSPDASPLLAAAKPQQEMLAFEGAVWGARG